MAHWKIADPYAGGRGVRLPGPQVIVAILAFAAVMAGLVLVGSMPVQLVLPALSLVALVAAGSLALLAGWLRTRRRANRVGLWDLAGACAFIGFAAGMISQPEQVLALFGLTAP